MALLNLNETPSQKASVAELAEVFEKATEPMTLFDAFMELHVLDPARQRSLQAAFLKECREGGKYSHLVGSKVRPSTTARGRVSAVFEGVQALPPKMSLVKRSDAFQGIRAIDRSTYAPELRAELDRVTELNLTGRAGTAVNRLAVEYDHALELATVKIENIKMLAEERRKLMEELIQVLNRITGGSEGDDGGGGRRIRPGSVSEAAE